MTIASKILGRHPLLNPGQFFARPTARTRCPCCGVMAGHRRSRWFYLYTRCRRCRSIFVWPRPRQAQTAGRLETVVDENVTAAFAQVDFDDLQPYVDRIRYAAQPHWRGLDHLAEMRFLDFGCGFGRIVAAAGRIGFQAAHGYDASAAVVRLARQAVVDDRVMIAHRIDQLLDHYDVIICEDVIEHCLDPASVLADLFSRLAPGGVLFISTPVINGISGWLLGQAWWCAGPADHLQLYTHHALANAAEQAGFDMVDGFTNYLIPWLEGPPENRIDTVAEALWHRLNRAVQARRTTVGDNWVMRVRRPKG